MTVEVNFKEKFNKLFEHLAKPGKQPVDDDLRSLQFGDYLASKEEEKLYDEIKDIDLLREVYYVRICLLVEMLQLISSKSNPAV